MLFVNFKVYEQGTGEAASALAKVLEEVSGETKTKVILALQASDIKEIAQTSKLEAWSQHVDSYEPGAHTGSIIAEAVKADGARGTFLNHSEHKFENSKALEEAHKRAKEVGLKTLVFAGNVTELKSVLKLKPDFVSYEPPELVGSKTTSVAKSKPEVISQSVEVSKKAGIPLIVGAGIKSAEDVQVSMKLGASGVAVASDIVKAKDPKKEALELIEGFK